MHRLLIRLVHRPDSSIPTQHLLGRAAARLGEIVKSRMTRPFVVTDKGVISAGLIDGALKGLEKAGLDYALFDGV